MPFKGLLLCLTLPYSSMIWADGPHERAQQLPIAMVSINIHLEPNPLSFDQHQAQSHGLMLI